jgi:hypothetical protein
MAQQLESPAPIGSLEPADVIAFERATLNALECLIRWQSILLASVRAVQVAGCAPSAVPHRVTISAIACSDLTPVLALWVGQAEQEGASTQAEALQLLSGKQIDAKVRR